MFRWWKSVIHNIWKYVFYYILAFVNVLLLLLSNDIEVTKIFFTVKFHKQQLYNYNYSCIVCDFFQCLYTQSVNIGNVRLIGTNNCKILHTLFLLLDLTCLEIEFCKTASYLVLML